MKTTHIVQSIACFLLLAVLLAGTACSPKEEPQALPTSGKWKISADFGEIVLAVSPDSKTITEIAYNFSDWTCGPLSVNGGVSIRTQDGWPITDGKFNIRNSLDQASDHAVTVQGTFDKSGTTASGTWEEKVPSVSCSGKWSASAPSPAPAGDQPFRLQAALWTYTSLCDFRDPPNWPSSQRFDNVSFSMSGCKDLEDQYGHPPAVRLSIENITEAEHELIIEGLKSITLQTNDKQVLTPIILRQRQTNVDALRGKMTVQYSLVTEFTGTWALIMAPNQTVDLVVLFPTVESDARISIGDLAPVAIRPAP